MPEPRLKPKAKEAPRCSVPDCWMPAKIKRLCYACYAGLRYWLMGDKTPADLMNHREKTRRLSSRMDMFISDTARLRHKAKVVPIRKRATQ